MAATTPELHAAELSVLMLEDDLLHGALLRMVLEATGFEAHVAATVEEAWATLQQAWPDIILVAWDADGIDGRAVLTSLRARVPGLHKVPAVLMTDREMNARARLELSLEGYRWILQKPIVVTSLPKLIMRTVAGTRAPAWTAQARNSDFSARFVASGRTASGAFMDAVR